MASLLTLLPTVERPKTRLPLSTRLTWTAVAVLIYLAMTMIPLYGIDPETARAVASPIIAIIFGMANGTLAQLGVGPIVIAGILLEILVFTNLIKLNLERPEDRAKFDKMYKVLALVIAVGESFALWVGGQFGEVSMFSATLIAIQLAIATAIILLLDDMLVKGWGIGSAVSLIIFVSVVSSVFIDMFSWNAVDIGGELQPIGIIPALAVAIYNTVTGSDTLTIGDVIYRGGYPDVISLVTTIVLAYIILLIELARVNIPTVITQYGVRYNVPLRLMYVSVLPIIFAAYTLALISQMLLGVYMSVGPIPGLVDGTLVTDQAGSLVFIPAPFNLYYYITPAVYRAHPITPDYVVLHLVIMVALTTFFAWVWVNVAGLGPEEQARRFVRGGLHIPGFRQSEAIIARLLDEPIRRLTLVSGMLAGFIAGIADIIGIFGGGIGLILLVQIAVQYYALLLREGLLEAYPALRRAVAEIV